MDWRTAVLIVYRSMQGTMPDSEIRKVIMTIIFMSDIDTSYDNVREYILHVV